MAQQFTIPGLTMSSGSSLPANSSISFMGGTPISTVAQAAPKAASVAPSTSSLSSSPSSSSSANTAPFDAATAAATQQNNALLSSLNTQYDYNAAQAQGQLTDLGNQKDQSLTAIDNELDSVKDQVGTEKTTDQTNNENQIIDAGSVAASTQAQNRNILRSLGILNSSAAAESLAKPMNQFDQQRAQLGQALTQRFGQLDDFLNAQVASHQAAVQSIQQNYQSLVGKIQTDLRFNERQRADAIQAANSALTGHLADIQSSLANYQSQVNSLKQTYATQAAQVIQGYQQPTANLSSISDQTVNAPQDTSQSAYNIFQDPNKENQVATNSLTA